MARHIDITSDCADHLHRNRRISDGKKTKTRMKTRAILPAGRMARTGQTLKATAVMTEVRSDCGQKTRVGADRTLVHLDLGFDNRKGTRAPLPRRPRDVAPIRAAASATVPARYKPSLVVANDSDDSDDASASRPQQRRATYEQRATQTFGQRAREAATGSVPSSKRKTAAADDSAFATGDDDQLEVIRGAPGGGMEMSFVPQPKSKTAVAADKQAAKAKKAAEKREKATFGAGMMKGTAGALADEDEGAGLEGEAESGRTRMRKPQRSASRNVTRQLK